MAEVTGNIGDQYVELDNAATEETLQDLVQVMALMAKKVGKSDGNYKKKIDGLMSGLGKIKKVELAERMAARKNNEMLRKAQQDREDDEKKAQEKRLVTWKNIDKLAKQTIKHVAETVDQIAGMGDSVTGLTSLLGKIPIIGETLQTTLGPVAAAAERTQSVFVQAASAGATFNGSVLEMVNSAGRAGLTLESFSGIVAKNSQGLALFAEGTENGAIRFAKLSKEMRTTVTKSGLANLGYTTESANEAMAGWVTQLARTGASRNMSDQQIIASSTSYMKNLDALSKLTGESKEALQAERDQRLNDSRYRARLANMDAESQKQLERLMNALPAELEAGAKEILATGTAQSESGRQFMAYMQQSGQDMVKLFGHISNGGKVTADMVEGYYDTMQGEASKLAKSDLGNTLATYLSDDTGKFMVDAFNMSQRQLSLAEANAKTAKAAGQQTDATAKNIVQLKQYSADLAAQANNLLLQFMPQLKAVLGEAYNGLSAAMTAMANHTELVVGLVVASLVSQIGLAAKGFVDVANKLPFLGQNISSAAGAMGRLGQAGAVAAAAWAGWEVGSWLNEKFLMNEDGTGKIADMVYGWLNGDKNADKTAGDIRATSDAAIKKEAALGAKGSQARIDMLNEELAKLKAARSKAKDEAGLWVSASENKVLDEYDASIKTLQNRLHSNQRAANTGDVVAASPTSPSVQSPAPAAKQLAEDKTKADAKKHEEVAKENKTKTKEATSDITTMPLDQITSEKGIEGLNTRLDALRGDINRLANIASDQLRVQKGLSGDAFT